MSAARVRPARPVAGRCFVALAWLVTAFAALAALAPPAFAFSIEFRGRPVKRALLAIYDSRAEGAVNQTRLHKLADMPLNHLGFHLVFHDVNTPLPEGAALDPYRAVVTWFVEPLADPTRYLRWLDKATERGLKYVMLGEVAPLEIDENIATINRVLGRIGVKSAQYFIELTHKTRVVSMNAAMIGFERKLDKVIPGFPVIEPAGRNVREHIVLEAATASGPMRSAPVVTSETGGYVAQNYTVTLDPNTDRIGWVIDPFRFFRLALGDERFPIPDVTTASGRRIYFSHIDGDGWNNLSEIEGYRAQQALSAEVIAKEAIEPYPDLPVSVGLIAADLQPLLGGNAAGIAHARRLFSLKQVEVASHTHSHPYDWQFFERYDRASEERKMADYRPPDMPLKERLTAGMLRIAGKAYANARYNPCVSGSDELPRTYLCKPFDLELEVKGALKFSEQFAPSGKRAKLYLWSGNTTPFEGAIAAARAVGARNLNGGDSRLDREYPSVAYVPAISRPVGRERQIYAVNSNENTYTNDWTGPFGGQMMLANTLDNTEKPRRLKAFNLYYHMYSGEKPASLRAIRHYLALARASEVTPIPASDYAAMADDFFGVAIEQIDLFSWSIKNAGAVGTVRFDDADHLVVDLVASRGVIGANRHQGAIYVTLDPTAETAQVTLTSRETNDPRAAVGSTVLHLVHSRWRFSSVRTSDCSLRATAEGYGPGEMVWRARPNRAFRVKVTRDGRGLAEEIRWADREGRLSLRLAVDARDPVEVGFECHE